MKIIQKISQRNKDMFSRGPVTVAFLGDSVTQGCFENFMKPDGNIETVFEQKSSYAMHFKEILNFLYPKAQINIINCGISGDTVESGLKRYDRDIRPYKPDLVVVAFGLNDSCHRMEFFETFKSSLKGIFNKVKEDGAECIFVAENMIAPTVSDRLEKGAYRDAVEWFVSVQNSGDVDTFFNEAMKIAKENGVKVLDLYSKWKKLADNGVEVCDLFANHINHPKREIHFYMAAELVEKLFEE